MKKWFFLLVLTFGLTGCANMFFAAAGLEQKIRAEVEDSIIKTEKNYMTCHRAKCDFVQDDVVTHELVTSLEDEESITLRKINGEVIVSISYNNLPKHRGRYAPIVLIYGTRVQFSKLPKYIEASVSPVRYKQTMEWSPEAKPFVPLIE